MRHSKLSQWRVVKTLHRLCVLCRFPMRRGEMYYSGIGGRAYCRLCEKTINPDMGRFYAA